MKKAYKILALMLSVLFVIPFTGCKTDNTNAEDSQKNVLSEDDTSEAYYLDTLPKNTTGYLDLNIFAIDTNCIPATLEENADSIATALYKRDFKVKDYFGVQINYTEMSNGDSAITEMYTSVMSGENSHNIFIQTAYNLMSAAVSGCLQDLNSVENINLDKEWWCQSLNSNLKIKDTLYCSAGGFSQWYYGAPICMAYNKSLMKELKIYDIYELVMSDNWTLEKMKEICVDGNISEDLNDNGVSDVTDKYSISCASTILYGLFASAGGVFSETSPSNEITVNLASDRNIQILDDIISVFNTNTSFFASMADSEKAFTNGNALFYLTTLGGMTNLPQYDIEYGIIPCPKYSADQEKYISCAWPISNYCIAIPFGLSSEETSFAGLMAEAYCYTSYEIVKPAKYDTLLKYRVANDEKSSELLDVIFYGLYFDLNLVMDFGGSRSLLHSTIKNGTTSNFTSGYQFISSIVDEDIKAFLKTLK